MTEQLVTIRTCADCRATFQAARPTHRCHWCQAWNRRCQCPVCNWQQYL